MNIDNLKEGMIIKNYKELCKLLEIRIYQGNSKDAQMKELQKISGLSKEQAKAFADKYNFPIFETSAITGAGVEEAFQHLIQTVYDSNQGKSNNNIIID